LKKSNFIDLVGFRKDLNSIKRLNELIREQIKRDEEEYFIRDNLR